MMSDKAVVINADDVGMTEGATSAAEELFRLNKLSSCSVAPNFPGLEKTLLRIKNSGGTSGIHLNITEGAPVSPPSKIQSLIGSDGQFPGLSEILFRAATGALRSREIKIEMEAQFHKFLDSGGSPSHIDGHHHIHLIPSIAEKAAELAVFSDIKYFRRATPGILPFHENLQKNLLFFAYKQLFSVRGEKFYLKHGISDRGTPVQLSDSTRGRKGERYEMIQSMSHHPVELIFHPSADDGKKPETKAQFSNSAYSDYLFLKGLDTARIHGFGKSH